MIFKALFKSWNQLVSYHQKVKSEQVFKPTYRLVEINQDEEGYYQVTIQLIGKNIIYKTKPEEILGNDSLVDQFSPRDVRALTYLGYLGINAPKYKILAQKLSTNQDNLIFTLKKKGSDSILTKTALEILKETDILNNISSSDANMVGYTAAVENMQEEKHQKQQAINSLPNSKKDNTH